MLSCNVKVHFPGTLNDKASVVAYHAPRALTSDEVGYNRLVEHVTSLVAHLQSYSLLQPSATSEQACGTEHDVGFALLQRMVDFLPREPDTRISADFRRKSERCWRGRFPELLQSVFPCTHFTRDSHRALTCGIGRSDALQIVIQSLQNANIEDLGKPDNHGLRFLVMLGREPGTLDVFRVDPSTRKYRHWLVTLQSVALASSESFSTFEFEDCEFEDLQQQVFENKQAIDQGKAPTPLLQSVNSPAKRLCLDGARKVEPGQHGGRRGLTSLRRFSHDGAGRYSPRSLPFWRSKLLPLIPLGLPHVNGPIKASLSGEDTTFPDIQLRKCEK